jgi:signal transduction histidine kinase
MDTMTTIRRAARELAYSALGALAGSIGFTIVVFLLAPGVLLTLSVLGTVLGLPLLIAGQRMAGRFGGLHRRLLRRFLGYDVPAPVKFEPGTGILGRLDKRLRYRQGWRAVLYTLIKAVIASLQGYALVWVVEGLIDMTYPVLFGAFSHASRQNPVKAPMPFAEGITISNYADALLAGVAGVALVAAGYWMARLANLADRGLITSLLGMSKADQRISELERSRALAVDDSAAVLRRVERDLHDGAQMRLAALAMNLGMAQEKADDPLVRDLIDAAQKNAVDALSDLRDLARGIHPPVLDNGLPDALESLAASSAIPATVTASLPVRPAPAIEAIAYFCAAELITNATKHSYANQIKIEISSERTSALRLRVTDDGVGGADAARGTGLDGLRQRVSPVDGKIDVDSPAGGPTVVTVELPLTARGADADGASGDRGGRRAASRGADPAAGGQGSPGGRRGRGRRGADRGRRGA